LVAGSALGAITMVAGVVGVVFLTAGSVGALVEASAKFGSAACEDTPHSPVVSSGELTAMSLNIGSPVLTQDVCEGEGHLWERWRLGSR